MDAENDTDAQQVTGCPVTGKAGCQLDAVSLIDPEISAHPNAFYRALRTEDPVHYDEKLGMWLVSRYKDIVALLRLSLIHISEPTRPY